MFFNKGGTMKQKWPKPPLQALLISPGEKDRMAILAGNLNISIRLGHRDYVKGPVMLCCHIVPFTVMANIASIKFCNVDEVTPEDYKAFGVNALKELLEKLKNFYPDITPKSPVTVIKWESVEGWLAKYCKYYPLYTLNLKAIAEIAQISKTLNTI